MAQSNPSDSPIQLLDYQTLPNYPIPGLLTSCTTRLGSQTSTGRPAASSDGAIERRRTPLVSGSVQTMSPANTANGAASAMPAPNDNLVATYAITIGASSCVPRDTL